MTRFIIFFMVVSCQTSQITRPIPISDASLQAKSISKADQALRRSSELFVEKKNLDIKKKPENKSGSLFSVKSPSAFLFSKQIPHLAGDFVTLKVEPISSSAKATDQNSGPKPNEASGGGVLKDPVSGDPLTTELTSSLPNLGPDDGSNGQVLSQIQAEVIDRTPEGDLIVRAERSSTVDGRNKNISFEATIPARVVADSNTYSTKDLRSVKFAESGSENIRRSSTAWNDEYSLRFSGFTETGSKNARQLADDKRKLQDVRERLDGRIKSFAADRSRFAKERTKFLDERSVLDSKLLESERLLKDKDSYISKLESELSQTKTASGSTNSTQDKSQPSGVSAEMAQDQAPPLASQETVSNAEPKEKKGDENVAKQ